MRHVLALILGGGQGSRLFPLTHMRSKPAVPIGGKYAPFSFYDPTCPIFTRERFLPPSRLLQANLRNALVSDGSFSRSDKGRHDSKRVHCVTQN